MYLQTSGSQTVGLKVTDANGGVGTATTNVTINSVNPTSVSAGGPYTATSGQPLSLNASGTCAVVACVYAWDLDNNGSYNDATGQAPSNTWYTVGGPYTIGVTGNGQGWAYRNCQHLLSRSRTPRIVFPW